MMDSVLNSASDAAGTCGAERARGGRWLPLHYQPCMWRRSAHARSPGLRNGFALDRALHELRHTRPICCGTGGAALHCQLRVFAATGRPMTARE